MHTTEDALDANAGPFMPFPWLRKLHSKFCFWVARPYRFVAPGPNTCRELRVAVCCRMQEESNSEDDGKDRGVPLVLLFFGNQNRNVLFQQLKWLARFFLKLNVSICIALEFYHSHIFSKLAFGKQVYLKVFSSCVFRSIH